MSDNEIYLLIKYIKSVPWRVAKPLSYIEEARCLKVKRQSLVVSDWFHLPLVIQNHKGGGPLKDLLPFLCEYVGLDSSVGIATRYGLDGPGIESRWGRDFPYLSRSALGPTRPPVQWVPGIFSRG